MALGVCSRNRMPTPNPSGHRTTITISVLDISSAFFLRKIPAISFIGVEGQRLHRFLQRADSM